jgi:hypothetical protein
MTGIFFALKGTLSSLEDTVNGAKFEMDWMKEEHSA